MKRRNLIKAGLTGMGSLYLSGLAAKSILLSPPQRIPFEPTWDSLSNYEIPQWFGEAKFGMWAHWSPQCQPEHGDWYARKMYQEGDADYEFHLKKYGHPSKFGFKDVINEWKADQWDPEELVSLYKRTGAKYFMALANHHDNFDLFDSKYQSWNSTKIGPKRDIIDGWARAAKRNDLPFAVSVHAAHAWSWYETSQRSDKKGPLAGIPYDGKVTKADGKGKWWDGFDPQELYEQRHPLSENSEDNAMIHKQWDWGNGVSVPSRAYCEKFYNRTIDLLTKYEPDLVYFDDTAFPLWPVSDAGLRIAAHMYNASIKKYGKLKAVITGKILTDQQKKCMVWDIERGQSNQIEPKPWQTDTCIGNWHYSREVYEKDKYKSPAMVIHILADVVSKNGNLMLNIPVRGNGTIDEKERAIVESIGEWMRMNSECIYASKPWKVFGEGPALADAAPMRAQGFNEGKSRPFTSEDFRFTTKGNVLYAIMLGWPTNGSCLIKSLGQNGAKVANVSLIGHQGKLEFIQDEKGLKISLPAQAPCKHAYVFKIDGVLG